MLFRVKSRNYKDMKPFHYIPVGTVLHSTMHPAGSMGLVDKQKCIQVITTQHDQLVPASCLQRIPNTKANLRKYAKGLL